MEIKIQGNYYIKSNRWEYQLAQYKGTDKKGNDVWDYLKHKSSMEGVLEEYCELQIKTIDATEFETVIQKVKELKELINEVKEQLEIEVE